MATALGPILLDRLLPTWYVVFASGWLIALWFTRPLLGPQFARRIVIAGYLILVAALIPALSSGGATVQQAYLRVENFGFHRLDAQPEAGGPLFLYGANVVNTGAEPAVSPRGRILTIPQTFDSISGDQVIEESSEALQPGAPSFFRSNEPVRISTQTPPQYAVLVVEYRSGQSTVTERQVLTYKWAGPRPDGVMLNTFNYCSASEREKVLSFLRSRGISVE